MYIFIYRVDPASVSNPVSRREANQGSGPGTGRFDEVCSAGLILCHLNSLVWTAMLMHLQMIWQVLV